MRSINNAVLNAADATQSSQTSGPIDATSVVNASCVGIAVGGTITGTLKFQACNDLPAMNPSGPINWVDCSESVSVTGAGNFLIPKFDCCYQWLRVVYTKSSSAAGATITALVKTNGV